MANPQPTDELAPRAHDNFVEIGTIERWPIEQLREHPDNARRGDSGMIAESIARNGFHGTIVVQRATGYVLAGNHRLRAAQTLGAKSLRVNVVDEGDMSAIRRMIADNRTNDLAAYDTAAYRELILALDGDYDGTGFTQDSAADLIASLELEPLPPDESTADGADEPHKAGGDRIVVRVLDPTATEAVRAAIGLLLAENPGWQASCSET